MKTFAFVCGLGILSLASLNAQETTKFSFDFGAGYTLPVGSTSNYIDPGWNLHGGAGYNFSPYLSTMINVGYDSMGINSGTLANIGVPGGGMHIFHATFDPVVHLMPKGRLDFYLTGGGGLYHRHQDFIAPNTVFTSAFVPFLGINQAGGTSQLLAVSDVYKPGYDVGGGLNLGAVGHGKIFMEARYHHIFMNNAHTDFIPVTFGFRW